MSRISILFFVLCLGFLVSCGRSTHEYLDNKDVKIKSIQHAKDGEFLVVTAVLVNNDGDSVQHSVYRIYYGCNRLRKSFLHFFGSNCYVLGQTRYQVAPAYIYCN